MFLTGTHSSLLIPVKLFYTKENPDLSTLGAENWSGQAYESGQGEYAVFFVCGYSCNYTCTLTIYSSLDSSGGKVGVECQVQKIL